MSHPLDRFSTISLIGMPGAGKSTVGVLLAKAIGRDYCDTDVVIQVQQERTLQQILDTDGHLALRAIEEEVLLHVPLAGAVIATGGSVVYSEPAMQRLMAAGPVVYLAADLQTLMARVALNPQRGIASDGSQTYADVYAERTPLYQKYADITVDAAAAAADQVAAQIAAQLAELPPTR